MENLVDFIWGYANPGINYAKRDPTFLSGSINSRRVKLHVQGYQTELGIFAGVCKQVKQNLPKLGWICFHIADIFRTLQFDLVIVFGCDRFDLVNDVINEFVNIQVLR